jgi:hypothetical protein
VVAGIVLHRPQLGGDAERVGYALGGALVVGGKAEAYMAVVENRVVGAMGLLNLIVMLAAATAVCALTISSSRGYNCFISCLDVFPTPRPPSWAACRPPDPLQLDAAAMDFIGNWYSACAGDSLRSKRPVMLRLHQHRQAGRQRPGPNYIANTAARRGFPNMFSCRAITTCVPRRPASLLDARALDVLLTPPGNTRAPDALLAAWWWVQGWI